MSTPPDLNPLHTRTGRQIISAWLFAASETFGLLGTAAKRQPKKEPTKAPGWYEKVEK